MGSVWGSTGRGFAFYGVVGFERPVMVGEWILDLRGFLVLG